MRNEFFEDKKINTFECDWKAIKSNSNLENKLGLLNKSSFWVRMERKLRQSKHSDSIYLYDKLVGRSAASNLIMGKLPLFNKCGATLYSTPIDNAKVAPIAIFKPLGLPSGFLCLIIKIGYILFCLEIS